MEVIKRYSKSQVEAKDNKISGYAAVFYDPKDDGTEYELWDGAVERIDPHAFDASLLSKEDIICSYNHDFETLLGRKSSGTLQLSVDDKGLRYDVAYDETDPDHQRIAAKIKRGDLSGSSFALKVSRGDHKYSREGGRDIYTITGGKLLELGPVIRAAYSGASVEMRSEDREHYEHLKEISEKTEQILAKIETEKILAKIEALYESLEPLNS